MKKIGIVTNYANANFGSALQSFALQVTLRRLGYDGENLRYTYGRKAPVVLLLKAILGWVRSNLLHKSRRGAFRSFRREFIREGKRIYHTHEDLTDANAIYDAFICGSDQIWAPNQYDEWYFLSFAGADKTKIAYAPSIGLPVIPDRLKSDVARHLKSLDSVSIREQQGAQLIEDLTGMTVPVVLDPTLLLDRAEWLNVAKRVDVPAPYALCYFLGKNEIHRKLARDYCDARGIKMISVHDDGGDRYDVMLDGIGPREFLGLVSGAAVIFTDSFHGTAFSVNMEKEFFTFLRFQSDDELCQNSRIYNFLDVFGLRERLIQDDAGEIGNRPAVDFSEAGKRLKHHRDLSEGFLRSALSEVRQG